MFDSTAFRNAHRGSVNHTLVAMSAISGSRERFDRPSLSKDANRVGGKIQSHPRATVKF